MAAFVLGEVLDLLGHQEMEARMLVAVAMGLAGQALPGIMMRRSPLLASTPVKADNGPENSPPENFGGLSTTAYYFCGVGLVASFELDCGTAA